MDDSDRDDETTGTVEVTGSLQMIQRTPKEIESSSGDRGTAKNKRPASTFAEWLIAAATLVYAFFALLLWLTTRDSVEVTRHNIEISQRAWLIVREFVQYTGPLPADGKLDVPLAVENSGRTPAIYIQGGSAIGCSPSEPRVDQLDWSRTGLDTSVATIGPGQQLGHVIQFTVPQGCPIEAIENGSRTLFVYGYVNYWDEFGPSRGVTFCGYYVPGSKRFEFCRHSNVPW